MNRVKTKVRQIGTSRSPAGVSPASPSYPASGSGRESQRNLGPGVAQRIRALEEQRSELLEEIRRLNEAIYGAAQLQRMLSPPRQLRRGRFDIASEIFPARHLSGDFYDVQDGAESLNLAVGDIAGKGLVAALWFTYLVGLIRLHTETLNDPALVAAAANRDLARFREVPPTAALFAARLDPTSGGLEYCNAGQPGALLIRADRTQETLSDGGPILGAIPEAPFSNGRTTLWPGDTLIIHSDGITECRNECEEEFGSERLLAAALDARNGSAGAVLFSILATAQDFAGNCPQADDLTLMVVHRR